MDECYAIVPQGGENRKCVSAIDCEHILYFLLFEDAADERTAINSGHERVLLSNVGEASSHIFFACARGRAIKRGGSHEPPLVEERERRDRSRLSCRPIIGNRFPRPTA